MTVPCVRCSPETDSCENIYRTCVAANQVIKAKELTNGDFFRKLTGDFVYLVISESAVKFYKLDPSFVYGVSRYGNMCHVALEKNVVIVDGSGWKW